MAVSIPVIPRWLRRNLLNNLRIAISSLAVAWIISIYPR
jgi:hypothetical protein